MKRLISKWIHEKIVIINGHPNKESFNFGIAEAYKNGALKSGLK
jgi:putative NADPH-quinone reductase